MTSNFDPNQMRALKYVFEHDHLYFSRYFFKEREGIPLITEPHHHLVSEALDKVITGEIHRLIINVPPGYTKTELAVIAFMARGLAINPKSKFMHLSYSDDLALLNSQMARDIVESNEFQQLWKLFMILCQWIKLAFHPF